MNLRQMEYAVTVADLGSFTRAADALHISQSALSQGIAALEKDLGVALFNRLPRSVTPTAAGEAFLGPARQVLRDVNTTHQSVAAVTGLRTGRLDLVVASVLSAEVLGTSVGEFRRRYPGVGVHIDAAEQTSRIEEMVQEGLSELGFAQAPVADHFVVEKTFRQEIYVVCPPQTSLSGERVPFAEVGSMPMVTPGRATRQIQATVRNLGLDPSIAVETHARESIVPLVLAGAGVTFTSRYLAEAAKLSGAVIAGLDPPFVMAMAIFRREGPVSPTVGAFLDVLSETAGSLPDEVGTASAR